MNMQDFLVYIIIGCTLFFIIKYVYKQITNKDKGCNCGSCPRSGGKCKCGDTQK